MVTKPTQGAKVKVVMEFGDGACVRRAKVGWRGWRRAWLCVWSWWILTAAWVGGVAHAATVKGTVIGKSSGVPRENVRVALCRIKNPKAAEPVCRIDPSLKAKTAEDGAFKIGRVPKGRYVVVYAFGHELRSKAKQWSKLKVHYEWPAFVLPQVQRIGLGETPKFTLDWLDVFGGSDGPLPGTASVITAEGVYLKKRAVYGYPNDGAQTSKAYGLCMEYVGRKVVQVAVGRGKVAPLMLKVTERDAEAAKTAAAKAAAAKAAAAKALVARPESPASGAAHCPRAVPAPRTVVRISAPRNELADSKSSHWLEVVSGEYELRSGAKLLSGSGANVAGSQLAFSRDVGVEIGMGANPVEGRLWPQGATLVGNAQGGVEAASWVRGDSAENTPKAPPAALQIASLRGGRVSKVKTSTHTLRVTGDYRLWVAKAEIRLAGKEPAELSDRDITATLVEAKADPAPLVFKPVAIGAFDKDGDCQWMTTLGNLQSATGSRMSIEKKWTVVLRKRKGADYAFLRLRGATVPLCVAFSINKELLDPKVAMQIGILGSQSVTQAVMRVD